MAEIELDLDGAGPGGPLSVTRGERDREAAGDAVVMPLGQLAAGQRARIVHLAPDEPALLLRLSNLGLVPGATVTLRQRRPAAVVSIGATTLALDPEIARWIFVSRIAPS